jgi:hypothetical protein
LNSLTLTGAKSADWSDQSIRRYDSPALWHVKFLSIIVRDKKFCSVPGTARIFDLPPEF